MQTIRYRKLDGTVQLISPGDRVKTWEGSAGELLTIDGLVATVRLDDGRICMTRREMVRISD